MQDWRDIPRYEGSYQINLRGQVRSLDRITVHKNGRRYPRTGRVLCQSLVLGYPVVGLSGSTKRISRLLMLTFVGPPPGAGYHVCHNDGNPLNNDLSNLRYGTAKENRADTVRHGTSKDGERHGMAKLTREDVLSIRAGFGKFSSVEIAKQYGIPQDYVGRIWRGERWVLPEHFPPGWVAPGNHANAKLSAAQVRLIRSISKQFTQRDIADLFGVEQSNVSNIIRGATWRRAEHQPVTALAA